MIHGFAESEDFNAKIENGKNSQEKNYLIGKFDKKKLVKKISDYSMQKSKITIRTIFGLLSQELYLMWLGSFHTSYHKI